MRFVYELNKAQDLNVREVAAVALSVDRVGERLGLGGEGLLVGRDPKTAELLGGAGAGVAIDEDAVPSGFFQTLTGLEGSKLLDSMSALMAARTSGLIVKSEAKGSALVIWSRQSSMPTAFSQRLAETSLKKR